MLFRQKMRICGKMKKLMLTIHFYFIYQANAQLQDMVKDKIIQKNKKINKQEHIPMLQRKEQKSTKNS